VSKALGLKMKSQIELNKLIELNGWVDQVTSGLQFPTDDRTMVAIGCFDVAIEHQAAVALLCSNGLHGASFALLRVLAESLVRGLWLNSCATETEIERFMRGKLKKNFVTLINEYEEKIGTPNGVLTGFKETAWNALNGFTHTGYHQVSRRHSPGRVEGSYPEQEIAHSLGVAGALGLIAAGQLISLSGQAQLIPELTKKMKEYAKPKP
jgi:hypothetical protein